ncbi:MAG: hypothetical protein SFW67_28435 [Myxococcaceae bacterium]|nr:hypothetical protein [Myxococcaceae bacterium]
MTETKDEEVKRKSSLMVELVRLASMYEGGVRSPEWHVRPPTMTIDAKMAKALVEMLEEVGGSTRVELEEARQEVRRLEGELATMKRRWQMLGTTLDNIARLAGVSRG